MRFLFGIHVICVVCIFCGTSTEHSQLEREDFDFEVPPTARTKPLDKATLSPLADLYQEFYGKPLESPSRERQLELNQVTDLSRVEKALLNVEKMGVESACSVPRLEVVEVGKYYPDPTKMYVPRCTLLHRCSARSGCCQDFTTVCAPKREQIVAQYFISFPIGQHIGQTVEELTFTNHTECQCVPINNMPRLTESQSRQNSAESSLSCKQCPKPFTVRPLENGLCSCDCFDKEKLCLRIKKGKEALSDRELRCVEKGHCHPPTCTHGVFSIRTGQCPLSTRDHDRPNYGPHPHRWHQWERD